jgi:hypothetical protein
MTRIPVVNSYSATTNALVGSLALHASPAPPLRAGSLAFIPATQQWITNFHHNTSDASVDTAVFVFNASDGSQAARLDIGTYGFTWIHTVTYDPATDHIIVLANDISGAMRLVAIDRSGNPLRSYTIDAVPNLTALAAITSGPNAGDFGAMQSQPGIFSRVALP